MIILTLVLCSALLLPFAFGADPVKDKSGHFKMTANDEQLERLNSLQGKNVSYGEVIRTVYPEAVKSIPAEVLENMDNTPMQWIAKDAAQFGITTTQSQLNATRD
jgi:hypothetical protein